MTYASIVKEAKKAVKSIDTKSVKGHAAVEIDVEGEGEGAFYIELENGKVDVEPFEYYDRDCLIRTDAKTLAKLLKGDLDAYQTFADGSLRVEGDVEKAMALADALKVNATKKIATTKKTPAKIATTKKTTAKSAAAKKAPTKSATAKKTAAKKPAAKKTTAKK